MFFFLYIFLDVNGWLGSVGSRKFGGYDNMSEKREVTIEGGFFLENILYSLNKIK